MSIPVLVWDVDDVLNNLTERWLTADFPAVAYDRLHCNPPHELLGISREEYLNRLDRFRAANQEALPPRPEVLDFFRKHGGDFRHLALTAVPRRFAPVSARWVLTHFGDWIRTFHFVPSPRPDREVPEYDRDKTAFLQRLDRADCFIDDNPGNLAGAAAAGFRTLPFPAPWNPERGKPIPAILDKLKEIR